jgi:hypothetical protein
MERRIDTVAHTMLAALVIAFAAPGWTTAATLEPHTARAWAAYVAATEARIERELADGRRFLVQDFDQDRQARRRGVLAGDVKVGEMETTDESGRTVSVPDGIIHHWRGSVFVPGVTLDNLLTRLEHPSERGPHQEDVLALRVLERHAGQLRLFIKMTRTKIVTVTYNTEHDVVYRRHGQRRASSRSVATKIAEVDAAGTAAEREKPQGEDRGFLWRLNSYWRYEEVDSGVIVELESVTLSRTVPLGLRVLVEPLIDRVARESMGRTLGNLRGTYATTAVAWRKP